MSNHIQPIWDLSENNSSKFIRNIIFSNVLIISGWYFQDLMIENWKVLRFHRFFDIFYENKMKNK